MTNSTNYTSDKIGEHLEWAHPLVRDWFIERFGTATEPQIGGWPSILNLKSTLICAPTGSGKTLSAFLVCIDKLIRQAIESRISDKTEVVYVSPLKALSNDIQKNLEEPLAEISALAQKRGIALPKINIAVRTGDTLVKDRQAMLRKPPHILVTTPESLYLLLTASKSRKLLETVNTVIVDEIHALADDKRGSHLSISLERLEHLAQRKILRIGLSATQKPIELIAHFLVGNERPLPVITDVGHKRTLDIAIEVPASPLAPVASNDQWEETYEQIVNLINQHRSTLIFVNTRKQAERITMNLAKRLGEEAVATHHGSLSRKTRLAAEHALKTGAIKALIATASLELGIDIGFVDLVCQIGSPRSIAVVLQRIGRAGHWRGAIPKGKLFATTRDELIELAALVYAVNNGDLDKLVMPKKPLDILAQQIVAMCAVEEWQESDLFELITRAYPYRHLDKQKYRQVLAMLSEGISAKRGRYGSYILHDQVNNRLKGRRGARLAAITSGGAIPEANLYQVVAKPDGTVIGTLDEDFAIESNKGDIILLGNTSWRVRRVENAVGRVSVENAYGAPPTVPFWLGEGPARTNELSHYVSMLRDVVNNKTTGLRPELVLNNDSSKVKETITWLHKECKVDKSGAEQIIEYIVQGRAVLGVIPTQSLLVAERFFDEGGGMQLIIHSPFGSRINKAWGLALRKKFCRTFNFELQAAATENGLNISLGEQHSFPLGDVFYYLSPNTLRETLIQAVLASPLFATRWRWDATRSLALLRFMGGRKVPPYIQRLRSDDLLAAVFPAAAACQDNQDGNIQLPDHPLVEETIKDVLTEALDIEGLEKVIHSIVNGKIQCLAVDTPVPSVFSHEILNANPYAFLDDAPLEERRARAVEMRRILPDALLEEVGRLDERVISQVEAEIIPDIRDEDELHDFLQTVIAFPAQANGITEIRVNDLWLELFEKLKTSKRAGKAKVNGREFWVCAERIQPFRLIYPDAEIVDKLTPVGTSFIEEESASLSLIQGWMNYCGPISIKRLSKFLELAIGTVRAALLQLETNGSVLRGKFTGQIANSAEMEIENWQWCNRRILARIHKLTVTQLRRQVEPVTATIFMRWLAYYQHVAPGSQLAGEQGTLEVIRQLQGFEIAANAWEKQILSKRISNYRSEFLDRLCTTGAIGWGRLSKHPAFDRLNTEQPGSEVYADKDLNKNGKTKNLAKIPKSNRRIIPTSVAPVTFFLRDEADWMMSHDPEDNTNEKVLTSTAKSVKSFLKKNGASFFADIVRGTGLLKSEVENALWELVTVGFATADGFDNLRALIDPKRRAGQGRHGRYARPRFSSGRWSLLHTYQIDDRNKIIEATGRILLNRYGIVFRDLLTRESIPFKWRELLQMFRVLEARGEIYGGLFVNGFFGEQFALPEALESLRLYRNRKGLAIPLTLSATDPLNLQGIILPGEKISALSGRLVTIGD